MSNTSVCKLLNWLNSKNGKDMRFNTYNISVEKAFQLPNLDVMFLES